MQNYEVKLTFNAKSKEDVNRRMKALNTINTKLKDSEIYGLADILENKPKIVAIIRPLLEEGKDYTVGELLQLVPKIYTQIKNS